MLSRKKFLELTSKSTLGALILSQTGSFAFSLPCLGESENSLRFKRNQPVDINMFDSINDYLILENYLPGELLIVAYDMIIDASTTLPGDRNISIFAYNTTISNAVTLQGKNFFLFTNTLTVSDSAELNTSGTKGQNFTQGSKPALTGKNFERKNPKAPAADNKSFDNIQLDDKLTSGPLNGTSAGNVWINVRKLTGKLLVTANGGDGGKGENGKDGLDGFEVGKHPDNNSAGYPGMSGGDGAVGGYGGNAGNITLICQSNNTTDLITSINMSGKQGVSGEGGKKGRGGSRAITSYDKNGDPVVPKDEKRFPPYGEDGKPGITPNNTGERNGKDGVLNKGYNDKDYLKYVPLEFGSILLLKANSLYLNGYTEKNMNEAMEIYNFIITMANENVGQGYENASNTNEVKTYLAGYLIDYHTNIDGWKTLRQTAYCYLSQISMKLDFFGNPLNYAPNLDPSYLLNQYNKFIGLIKGFEEFAVTLMNQQKNIQITQASNLFCIQQYDNDINQQKKDIQDLSALVITLNIELEKRFLNIKVMQASLMKDDGDFQKELSDASGGCSLSDMIHFVTAVVEIVAAIYTMGATAALAAKGIADVVEGMKAVDTFANFKVALSSDGLIGKGLNDISQGMKDINLNEKKFKSAYQSIKDDQSIAPPTLVGVNKEKFDEVIDKYLNLPSAQKYKADFHNFIDYVDQTNQKRVQLTGSILAINAAYQNILIITKQKNNLQSKNMDLNKEKVSIDTKIAITNLYYQSKQNLIKMIYLQRSAIRFQDPTKDYADKNYDDYNIDTLKTDLFDQNFALIDSLNARNFYRRFNRNPYTLQRAKNKIAFEAFKVFNSDDSGTKIYSIEFKISTYLLSSHSSDETKEKINYLNNIFQNAKNIKVMGVQVALRSLEDLNKRLNFSIRHLGNSSVTTEANFQGVKLYTHLWKEASLNTLVNKNNHINNFNEEQKINLVGTAFGNGEKCYLGVSPFASWRVQIKANENLTLNQVDIEEIISKITSIDLYFWYYYENN